MNAGPSLVAIVSLLLAMAAAGGVATEQADVNSPAATRATTSRLTEGTGCPEWACGSNHNETMVGDAPSVQQTDLLSQRVTSLQAFSFSSFTNVAGDECPPWRCGTNHNETFVQDAAR